MKPLRLTEVAKVNAAAEASLTALTGATPHPPKVTAVQVPGEPTELMGSLPHSYPALTPT